MIRENTRVAIKPNIEGFHYQETMHFSRERVLNTLKLRRAKGLVKRLNRESNAVGVLFPDFKELLWFKEHELMIA